MGRAWPLAALALVTGGCWSPVTELVTSHTEAGGALTAAIAPQPTLTIKGLADATATPMTIEGHSPTLVVGMVIGTDDVTLIDGKTQLLGGTAVTLTVTPTSTSQLGVHLAGINCQATAATIHLVPDGKGHIGGDFSGSGADGCQTSGTLSDIPIDHGD